MGYLDFCTALWYSPLLDYCMNFVNAMPNKEKRLKRLRIAMFVVGTALAVAVGAAAKQALQPSKASDAPAISELKTIQVKTISVGDQASGEIVSTAGVVTAKTKIDVSALAGGTVQELLFSVGDSVSPNQLLATLYDGSTLTSYQTTSANYQNVAQSVAAAKQSAQEAVRLAQISVEQANQSVASAETSLASAEESYQATLPIHEQQLKKTIQDALVSYHTNLAGVQASLDDINYIIRAEGTGQLEDISPTLSINDPASLVRARESWKTAKAGYNSQILRETSEENIKERLAELAGVLGQTLAAANDAVAVLQYTAPNFLFTESELKAEQTAMVSLKTGVAQNRALVTISLDAIGAIKTSQQKEQTALQNAAKTAENQLEASRIARDSAEAQLSSARAGYDRELAGAQTSLNSASGSRNLASQAVADLSVRSPISGTATARYVEIGTKVAPGQKIAEVSQTDLAAIEVGLSLELAKRVRIGDAAVIEGTFYGVISRIDPTADSFSRKINMEIAFDNTNKDLIPETFVNVEIPLAPANKETNESVLVPLKAVSIAPAERYVFVVQEGKAKKVLVETGATAGLDIEITRGLARGDELIVEGNRGLRDGQEVYADQ